MKVAITSYRKLSPIFLSGLSLFGASAQQKVEEASADAPNLIYIISDQMRFSALSCMGNRLISTPNLDRLAAEGVLFTRAYSQCPVSIPSRACMLTGNSLANTGVRNSFDSELTAGTITGKEGIYSTKTYDDVLAENGYNCEYYGKWHTPAEKAAVYSNHPTTDPGSTKKVFIEWWKSALGVTEAPNYQNGALNDGQSGFYYMPDPIDFRYLNPNAASSNESSFGKLLIDEKYSLSSYNNLTTLNAIERNKNQKFSIHCSYHPPHPPLISALPYYGMIKNSDVPLPESFFVNNPSSKYYNTDELNSPYYQRSIASEGMTFIQDSTAVQNFTARYLEGVKEIDDKVGEIMKKLDDLGLTDKTMIVFCADHGEMMGSHGMNSKMVFYDDATRVPLIIRYPAKIAPGKRISVPVSLIDIRPTIEDYMNMPYYKVDGKTLRPFIEDTYDKNVANFTVSEWNATTTPGFMLRNDRYKLMIGQSPDAKCVDGFYDLKVDSLEKYNLTKNPNFVQTQKAFAESAKIQLLKWLKKVNSPLYFSVKARAIGKVSSTYVAYKNDVAKIIIAGISAMNNLPSGISYRILPGDTLELTVSNTATLGVVTLKSTVAGSPKNLVFEILPAFDVSTMINNPQFDKSHFKIIQSGKAISVSVFSEENPISTLQLYTMQGMLAKEIKMKDNHCNFNTDLLAKGLYLITAKQNSKVYTDKVLIK